MKPKLVHLLALMLLVMLGLILGSFFVSALGGQEATDTADTANANDPSSINDALQQGRADSVQWEAMNYADPTLDYNLINQYSNLVDGERYIDSFGAENINFNSDMSSMEWGADGTIAVGMDKLTAEAYKSFPSGTEVNVANNRIEVVYPAGKEVSVKNADSVYVIDGKNGVKVDGIIIKGKLQAKDGVLWLEPGQKIELNGFLKNIENFGESAERITFNGCGQGGVCVYDDKVSGDAKGICITSQDGIQLNIKDAAFNVGNQLNQNEIIKLQELLNRLGYTDYEGKALVADGALGDRTKFALQKYQQYLINGRHYLSGSKEDQESADGVPGEKTIMAINRDIGPSIYVNGDAYIRNSGESTSELYWIGDELRLSVGYISNNYLLSTPYYKDWVYGKHNSMSQAEASNPLMKSYQEGKYSSVQDVINDAYKQAGWKGGTPTKEQIEKADKIIEDCTSYTLTGLAMIREESPDRLFSAPVTHSDDYPAVEASSGARAGAKKEMVNTMDMLEWSASKDIRNEWLPGNKRVSSKPEIRKTKKGLHYHTAFDISIAKDAPVNLEPIDEVFGGGAYGIVEYVGSDKDMKDAGNHVFVGFYYSDGAPVLNEDKEHIGKLTMHHNKIEFAEGKMIYPNQEYATAGSTGRSTGPHVHVEWGSKRALVDERDSSSKEQHLKWMEHQNQK